MTELSWTLPSGAIQSLVIDATVREGHEAGADVTSHPIEQGADVSDHVRPHLDSLTLEVVVSNHPITLPTTQMDGVGGRVQSTELLRGNVVLAKANVLVFDDEFDRVQTVYQTLLDLKDAGTVLQIFTSLRDYDSMLLKRVSPTRTAENGNALVAILEAQQVKIVQSEIVDAPEPEETRGEVRQRRGRNNTDEEDEGDDDANVSFLARTLL